MATLRLYLHLQDAQATFHWVDDVNAIWVEERVVVGLKYLGKTTHMLFVWILNAQVQ
eukprot:m.15068 g.15068  ORF g.15068 m.15068 type:complete len:57 (-) comp6502_c0_seq2:577-747(-)